tara:strand:+ start:177 stop:494 length:318 start_codon:yes stop_codon:yes gene_type:complete
MNRQSITERALLIAMCNRDNSGCREEHSLMSSVCKALDSASNVMSLADAISGRPSLTMRYKNLNVLHMWCFSEACHSPFTEQEMRDAIAEAMLLARKELNNERSN